MEIGKIVNRPSPARTFGNTTELVSNDVYLGVEVELEGMSKIYDKALSELNETGLWEIVDDNSLRDGGREFIMTERGTNQPLRGQDVVNALQAFNKFITKQAEVNSEPVTSTRTSTHIHIDVRDLTVAELKRFILLYYTFEDILFKWAAPDRRMSPYCRPASEHPDIVFRAASFLATSKVNFINPELGNKYDALNYLSVHHHGTVEVRMLGACWDYEHLKDWINLLLSLRRAARDETLEADTLPELASQNGMEQFLASIFGDMSNLLFPHATPMDILRGVRLAQEILVASAASKSAVTAAKFFNGKPDQLDLVNKFQSKL